MKQKYKDFIKQNKKTLEKDFKYHWTWNLSDTVNSYISDEDYDALEANGETEEDWWLDNNHNCGYHLEWSCAEAALDKSKLVIEEDHEKEEVQGYLIEFLGFSTGFGEKNYLQE